MTTPTAPRRSWSERYFVFVCAVFSALAIFAHASGAVEAMLGKGEPPTPVGKQLAHLKSAIDLPPDLTYAAILKVEAKRGDLWLPAEHRGNRPVSAVVEIDADDVADGFTEFRIEGLVRTVPSDFDPGSAFLSIDRLEVTETEPPAEMPELWMHMELGPGRISPYVPPRHHYVWTLSVAETELLEMPKPIPTPSAEALARWEELARNMTQLPGMEDPSELSSPSAP